MTFPGLLAALSAPFRRPRKPCVRLWVAYRWACPECGARHELAEAIGRVGPADVADEELAVPVSFEFRVGPPPEVTCRKCGATFGTNE